MVNLDNGHSNNNSSTRNSVYSDKADEMSNVTPIRKESQHPALASMRLRIDNLERTISSLTRELEFLRDEVKKLGA
jgi:hypothetical protein